MMEKILHQLRLVVDIPLFTRCYVQVVNRISEPSTVSSYNYLSGKFNILLIKKTVTLRKTNNIFAPKNGWLVHRILSYWGGFGLFSGALAVSFREGIYFTRLFEVFKSLNSAKIFPSQASPLMDLRENPTPRSCMHLPHDGN